MGEKRVHDTRRLVAAVLSHVVAANGPHSGFDDVEGAVVPRSFGRIAAADSVRLLAVSSM